MNDPPTRSGELCRFDEFWRTYPRREGKAAAERAWARARRKVDPSLIIAGASRYAADPNREPQFTAHPATWLNRGSWEDDPLPDRNPGMNRSDARAQEAITAGRQLAAMNRDRPPPPTYRRNQIGAN